MFETKMNDQHKHGPMEIKNHAKLVEITCVRNYIKIPPPLENNNKKRKLLDNKVSVSRWHGDNSVGDSPLSQWTPVYVCGHLQ